jgi:hypothetical protein
MSQDDLLWLFAVIITGQFFVIVGLCVWLRLTQLTARDLASAWENDAKRQYRNSSRQRL